MTSVLHHGAPGSFKTFCVTQNKVVPAIKEGRPVVTNIRGLDNLDRFMKQGFEVHPDAQIIYVDPDRHKKDSRYSMATFFDWAPQGALICIDEAQKVYPSRLRNLDEFNLDNGDDRPSNVYEAFDEHRHYNWDIYLTTTNIAKVHKEVRQVCEIAYRHRDMYQLLPWKKGYWKEHAHDPENSGKFVNQYVGTPKQYKADTAVFECYRSTKTGEIKHTAENRNILRDPRLRFFAVVASLFLVLSIFMGVQTYNRLSTNIQGDEAVQVPKKDVLPVANHVVFHDRNQSDNKAPDPVIDNVVNDQVEDQATPWRILGHMELEQKGIRVIVSNHEGQRMVLDEKTCKKLQDSIEGDYFCMIGGQKVTRFTGKKRKSYVRQVNYTHR